MAPALQALSGPNPDLAAIRQLAENSRQGFGLVASTMRWASGWVISSTSLGIKGSLYDGDVGSRSTGKERDQESGNDYFGARYYASSMGRFLSPDEPFADFDPDNPQSWNLYGYVRNNPLINTDPDGTDCVTNNGDGTATINSGDCSGKDPNNEYYYDCGDGNDGCLVGATSANMTSNGALALNKGNTIFTISNFGYSGGASFSDSLMYNTFGPPSAGTWNNSAGAVNTMGAALATGAGVVAPEMLLEDTELIGLGLSAGDEDTFVIGKVADLNKGLGPGEKKLDLPDQGNPKANWAQNSSKLRQAMSEGKPIRDVSAGNPGSNTGFLRAERNLLQNHGWTLQGEYWVPPGR